MILDHITYPFFVYIFYIVVTYLQLFICLLKLLVFFCLFKHLFVIFYLYVGNRQFSLLHHIVLQCVHLNPVLSSHKLDCINIFFIFFLRGLFEKSVKLFMTLVKLLLIFFHSCKSLLILLLNSCDLPVESFAKFLQLSKSRFKLILKHSMLTDLPFELPE